MNILIPIGGTGTRFKNKGYKTPKALIKIFGKPMLYHLIDNLNLSNVNKVIIPYNKEYKHYNFEESLKKNYPNISFKFQCLEKNTRGAAETILFGLKNINENEPILCLDSDNFYLCDIISKWNKQNCVFTFEDSSPAAIFSYIIQDKECNILDIQEKNKISDYACCGAYGFNSINELKIYISKIIKKNVTQKSEFYTSGIIKEMIINNCNFKNINVKKTDYVCIGTPLQLRMFYNNFPKTSAINNTIRISPKRICFDLDNTLVSYPTIKNDYTSVKPINKNIMLLKYLKKMGNTIIIYTARRMKTHKGNNGKLLADIGKITFDTLDKFHIPYDEIYFGKPYADFYIDDLAINCFDDIEKELGFYNNTITPRFFNSLDSKSIEIITKKGHINGEIYYYKNIPKEIKDLFPIFIGENKEKTEYSIQKIQGITVNEMFLAELLTTNTLENILNSIKRIQTSKLPDKNDKIDIYYNYIPKLKKRYEQYDYSKFDNSKQIYTMLIKELKEYKNKNKGKCVVIHGDTVFSNILINEYDKIKFIDMRGKLGNILTICGDWLYDWAKIYQSLIGYDEILMDKVISAKYKDMMINYFKSYFINNYSKNDFENLKLITKSLIFSLIQLHNNKTNQVKFFNLISSNYL